MIVFRHCSTAYHGIVLEFEGHAGYAEAGKDIVCAGVSALCMAAEAALTGYDSRIEKEIRDGYARFRCRYTPETGVVARTVISGMESIAHLYPDNVRIENLNDVNARKKFYNTSKK